VPRGGGGAASRGVAGRLAASVQGATAHLGHWVGLGTGGTGALGLLCLSKAHSVLATCIAGTDVHAVVGESVTELCWRTVCVGEAGNSLAATYGVGGVALEFSRRTCALGGVVLGDTDSLGTAYDVVAGRNTLFESFAAHLLRALGVRCALILGDQGASCPVIWIPTVSIEALTEALVVAGPALRVGGAVEELADGGAAENAE
jgi:hypothetical protein